MSDAVNGQEGLKVVVIGAGIGGLSAAILLRQQGHKVIICESSKFSIELGAAIHIPPNAGGLLELMGISASAIGANPCLRVTSYTAGAHKLNSIDNSSSAGLWQHPWRLGHRVKLHTTLKDTALKEGAELRLATPVVSVDAQSASVTTAEGLEIHADVVVGADGVHAVSRSLLAGADHQPFGSGKSAFRFLIPRQVVVDDPQTRPYAECDGELVMVYHQDRRIVMYPTSNNTLLNLVCIHPEAETGSASSGDWNNKATREMLLRVYEDFHDDFKAILTKVDESSLKIWTLLDMEVLESWTHGRLALLGDAAHPFLPHQGQGGAVAMEDAVALSVVLERGLRSEEVQDRLTLYQQIRKGRADRLQQYTRLAGEDLKPGETAKINMMEFVGYNFGYDEHDNSSQKLREWKWSKYPSCSSRGPVAFGPMPGPRSNDADRSRTDTPPRFVTATITIKTSRTVLQNMFPPGSNGWKFSSPGTFARCSFSQTTLDGLKWLGGQGHSRLGLYIHGVEYTGSDGRTTKGTYMPVLFEYLAESITSEREEFGTPVVFSDISVDRSEKSYLIRAGWRGVGWGSFDLSDLRLAVDDASAGYIPGYSADESILIHRQVPEAGIGCKGQLNLEHSISSTTVPANLDVKVDQVWTAGSAAFVFDARDKEKLPTLHHIVERLAEIPVYEHLAAHVVEGTGVPEALGAGKV